MASAKRVAVVTGANKGIGYATVRALCKQFKGDVFLTARSDDNGADALKMLNKEGLSPKYHQLDITDKTSIHRLGKFIKETYGGLDVLINNAGMAYKFAATEPFSEQAEVTVRCNFTGTLDVCRALFPLLKPHARVVNVSSMTSQYSGRKCKEALQSRFTSSDITMEELEQLMEQFVALAKAGTHQQNGWPSTAYGTSKIGVSVMSFIQQRQIDRERPRDDIIINACCPGYVQTDMTSQKGHKTIDEGADTSVYLALLPPNATGPKGKFVSNRKIQNWP